MSAYFATEDDPRRPEIVALLEGHLEFARAQSPPEDVHALDVDGLVANGLTFFSIRENGELLGVGALNYLDDSHAEIKSMHTVPEARGRGVGRAMVEHLLTVARENGCERISLETGTMDAFAPARGLYESYGFEECEPFGPYCHSPNSICMTLVF
jgi:putative acetyltransferase